MSNSAKDYENLIANAASQKDMMKMFAQALAKAESQVGLKPKVILVNGIIKDDEITAQFDVEKDKLADLLNVFLDEPKLNPDIIVNGIPANTMRQLSVKVGRQVNL